MSIVILAIATIAACYTDIRWGKIPNALVAPLLIAGLASQFLHGPYVGLAALAAAIAAVAIGTFAFAMRLMGGGDVKFFVAAVATLGAADGARFIVYTLVCGGILAVAYSLWRGSLGTMLANVRASAMTMTAPVGSAKMPYALALLGGTVTLAAAQTILPMLRFPL